MAILSKLEGLKAVVSSQCQILTDSSSAQFQEYAKRWTDIDSKTPGAIVLPTTEEDIQKTVCWSRYLRAYMLKPVAGPMGRIRIHPVRTNMRRPQPVVDNW